jgi:hypothetical protein
VAVLVAASLGASYFAGSQATKTITSTEVTSLTTTQLIPTTQTAISTTTATSTMTTTVTVTSTFTTTSTTVFAFGNLGAWNRTTDYPFPPSDFSCVSYGRYAYCVGGYSGGNPFNGKDDLNVTYYASLSTSGVGPWVRTTDYPIGIEDESCIASAGDIYCVGGDVGPNGRIIADVFYASLSSSGIGQWTRTTAYPYPVVPRCTTDSSYIYCIGPHLNGTSYTNTTDTYFALLSASGVGAWTELPSVPSNPVGCSTSDGIIYCFGDGGCPPLPPNTCSGPAYYAPLALSGFSSWTRTTGLPTAVYAAYVETDSHEYFFASPTLVAGLTSNGIGNWTTTTTYPASLFPTNCVANVLYIYCIGGVIPSQGTIFPNVYYARVYP